MRILELGINNHLSILEDFEWKSNKAINIFIGENGSGKSTLLRHLIDIFKDAYEYFVEGNQKSSVPDFDFYVKYEAIVNNTIDTFEFETNYVTVELSGSKKDKKYWNLRLDNSKYLQEDLLSKFGYRSIFPENLIAYYAGWDSSIKSKFIDVEERYKDSALGNYKGYKSSTKLDTAFSTIEHLPLINIDKIHFNILLSVLFSYEYNSRVDSYLLSKFNIVKEDKSTIVVHINKPKESYFNNDNFHFWGAKGEVANFLFMLREFSTNSIDEEDTETGKIFIFDTENWYRIKDYYLTESRFYNYLHLLNSSDFLGNIQIFFTKDSKSICNYYLSEGEQQLLTIFAIKEILVQTNSLVILDEPDTFLHPKWQERFITDLEENIQFNRNADLPFHNEPNFFITTHSPNLLNNSSDENTSVTILKNGKVQRTVDNFYGKNIRSINYDLMGVKERPFDITKRINDLFDEIEKENVRLAEKLYNDLVKILGVDDEDLIRAKTEIDLLILLQNDSNL